MTACLPPAGETRPDYRVIRQGVLLGTLTRTGGDFPWWLGVFTPTPAFSAVRALFDRERECLESDEMEGWDEAWEELAEGMVLEPVAGGEPITEFLLHIDADGRGAWWRY